MLINIASMCYLNAYLQVIASCPTLPACTWNMLSLSPEKFPLYCAMATLISSLVGENKTKETVDPTIFSKNSLKHVLIFFQYPIQINVSNVSAICSKYA